MASIDDSAPEPAIISACTAQDAAEIAALAESTFWQSHGHSASTNDIQAYVDSAFDIDSVRRELLDTRNQFFKLSLSGAVIGYSKLRMNEAHEAISDASICKLERLYVDSRHHGKGLGLTLFKHAVAAAIAQSQSGIWLYVWTENQQAIDFYTRQGFTVIGQYDFKISANHSNPNHSMYLSLEEQDHQQ